MCNRLLEHTSRSGDCRNDVDQYDGATEAFVELTRRAEEQRDQRGVALGKGQLGTVRLRQQCGADRAMADAHPSLAENPGLGCIQTAEVLLPIESLQQAESGPFKDLAALCGSAQWFSRVSLEICLGVIGDE